MRPLSQSTPATASSRAIVQASRNEETHHSVETLLTKNEQKNFSTSSLKRDEDAFGLLGDGLGWLGRKIDWHVRLGGSKYLLDWENTKSGLYTSLHFLPSVDWMESITSQDKNRRVASYWSYREKSENKDSAGKWVALPMDCDWEFMETDLMNSSRSPTALIAMRAALYRVLGDVDDCNEALATVSKRLDMLDTSKQMRRYIGPILAQRHGLETCSGEEYEREKRLVISVLHRVRAMYGAMKNCLTVDEIALNLFEVPPKHYEEEFSDEVKKKSADVPNVTGGHRFFPGMTRQKAVTRTVRPPDSSKSGDTYELVDLRSRVKKTLARSELG